MSSKPEPNRELVDNMFRRNRIEFTKSDNNDIMKDFAVKCVNEVRREERERIKKILYDYCNKMFGYGSEELEGINKELSS